MAPADPTRAWLEESAWLHRLARRLVHEPSAAADAAQEALVVGLERSGAGERPGDALPLRRWLAGVLRNLVRQERRGAARRRAREEGRTGPNESEATDELAGRLELQERLVARVRGLSEPYRTAIALRFLEDLPPREIAARLGVPLKTVHTRIERALVKLREELDREHGGRAWAALLVPLPQAPVPLPPPAPLAGSTALAPLLAMGTIWKWTGAAAALALLGYVVVQQVPRSAERAPGPVPPPSAPPELAETVVPASARAPSRVPLAAEAEANVPAVAGARGEATNAAAALLAGRVVDVERRGLAGLEVRFEPTSWSDPSAEELARQPRATSGAEGAFELELPRERGRLLASGRGFATLLAPGLNGELPPEVPLVVVAPAHTYAGTVEDETGQALAGIELAVRLTRGRALELQPGSLTGSVPLARVTSDAGGRFRLVDVAFVEGVALEVDAGGYERLHQDLPPVDDLGLRVVLGTPRAEEAQIAGRVRFADGRPAAGAWVSAGEASTRALEDGRFALAAGDGQAPAILRAVVPGFQPARLDLKELSAAERRQVELVLDGAALELAGRVVDGEGRPLAQAQVWVRGGEPFGMLSRRFGEVDFYVHTDVEELLASRDGELHDGRETRTDTEGRFRLSGLLAQDYDLFAMHPATQEIAWLARVPAGEREQTLVLAGAEPLREVRGHVVNFAGEPVRGALLRVNRQVPLPDGTRAFRQASLDFHAETDAEGAFRFEGLAVAGTHLLLNGECIASPQERALDQEPDLLDVRFRAPAPCHLRVFLADPERADSLMLLDEEDRPLSLSFLVGSVTLGAEAVTIQNGTSDLLRTDESARTLVLSRREEKERIPIHLVPGEVNELHL